MKKLPPKPKQPAQRAAPAKRTAAMKKADPVAVELVLKGIPVLQVVMNFNQHYTALRLWTNDV